jgi:hypothetical protein
MRLCIPGSDPNCPRPAKDFCAGPSSEDKEAKPTPPVRLTAATRPQPPPTPAPPLRPRAPYSSDTRSPLRPITARSSRRSRVIPHREDTALAQHPQGHACGLFDRCGAAATDCSSEPERGRRQPAVKGAAGDKRANGECRCRRTEPVGVAWGVRWHARPRSGRAHRRMRAAIRRRAMEDLALAAAVGRRGRRLVSARA